MFEKALPLVFATALAAFFGFKVRFVFMVLIYIKQSPFRRHNMNILQLIY